MSLKRFFEKLFCIDNFFFSKIEIEKKVIKSIIAFAKANHPNEFLAFLQGTIKKKILKINGLIYQPYYASKDTVFAKINFPNLSKVIGSVHSHPSASGASETDLLSFNKKGVIHLIISYPYRIKDITCYDFKGRKIKFEIV